MRITLPIRVVPSDQIDRQLMHVPVELIDQPRDLEPFTLGIARSTHERAISDTETPGELERQAIRPGSRIHRRA